MTLDELIDKLNLTILSGKIETDLKIQGGYVSDILSDVLANSKEGQVWVTLQTHENVLAVAAMKKIAAVVLVNGQKPDDDLFSKNRSECIPILGTQLTSFDFIGKLYQLLQSPI